MSWALAAAGLLVGAAAGYVIHLASPWLAAREGLEPRTDTWLRWGPPALGAATFALIGLFAGSRPSIVLIDWLWAALLVQIVFFDLEHRLILDRLLFPAMILAVALSLFTPHLGWKLSLLTGLVAGAVFLAVSVLGSLLLRAEVLGFGDVKLAAFMGLILGPQPTLQALLAGVLLAGVTSLVLVVVRVKKLHDTIAYGPYLCAGALLMLIARGSG